jgi:tetratricopeptide (TPR) repeat protein
MKRVLCAVLFVLAALGQAQMYANPKPTAEDLKQYKAIEKQYLASKQAYSKKKDAATKKKLVAATVKFGTAAMTTSALDRKVKYKKALALYREALKLDPKNKEAKNNSEMIVSIYKSMGRPVPQ